MTNLSGSLSYRKDSNSFYINETGTNDGWVPLPISVNAKDLSNEDLKSLAERLGGISKFQIYVDVDNPNASDLKDNTGTSKLTPFKSLERALLEVARRSFRTPDQEARLKETGDIFERYTINLAPGEYEIENTPGGFATISNYSDYQIASNLIQKNRDWIAAESLAITSGLDQLTSDLLLEDLYSEILDLAASLSSLNNGRVLFEARRFLNPDKNIICNDPLNPPNTYFVGIYTNLSTRQQAVLALQELKARSLDSAKNLGFITDPDITIDVEDALQIQIYNKIIELVDILINTLECTLDPRFSSIENFGLPSVFPEGIEPSKQLYTMYNDASSAGVILPRGVSIVGADLRKVIIRPKYVPDYTDPLAERGSIFKMTGANFLSGFTIKDKKEHLKSHHLLSSFEFCDLDSLDAYYEKVRISFSDKSIYHRAQDAANLLERNLEWVSKKAIPSIVQSSEINYATVLEGEIFFIIRAIVSDLRSLGKASIEGLAQRFFLTHIQPIVDAGEKATAQTFYKSKLDEAKLHIRDAINNEANPAEGGYVDETIIVDTSSGARCADVVSAIYSYIDILKNYIDGSYTGNIVADEFIDSDVDPYPLENSIVFLSPTEGDPTADAVNTTKGASPYIFSISLRSEYGLCGINGDGSKIKGLKSYLAAQFTIISLQKDSSAFTPDSTEVPGERFIGSSSEDSVDFRHFGYKVDNNSYAQLVSCFCIGPAIHYWASNGGEFSITNSTSNFGDISLRSEGFSDDGNGGGAFPLDKGHRLIAIKKPMNFEPDLRSYTLGYIDSINFTTDTITLTAEPKTYNYELIKSNPIFNTTVYIQTYDSDIDSNVTLSARLSSISDSDLVVNFNNKEDWERLTPVGGLFFERYVDTRSVEDKYYKFIVEVDKSESKKAPIPGYVYRLNGKTSSTQPFDGSWNSTYGRGNLYAILFSNEIYEPTLENVTISPIAGRSYYEVSFLNSHVNSEGAMEYYENLLESLRIDLDKDPIFINTSSANTNDLTYISTRHILDLSDVTVPTEDLIPTPGRFIPLTIEGGGAGYLDNGLDGEVIFDLNKPSTIRCAGQTWEYVGYYNYSTGLPSLQSSQVGEGLAPRAKLFKRVSKVLSQRKSGVIFATGMDEQGNFYIGRRVEDFRTGESSAILLGDEISADSSLPVPIIINPSPIPDSFDSLTVNNLTVQQLFTFNGSAIAITNTPRVNAENGLELYVGDNPSLAINDQGNIDFKSYINTLNGTTIVSATPPTSRPGDFDLIDGDLWFDSTSGDTFVYYTSNNNSVWVQI